MQFPKLLLPPLAPFLVLERRGSVVTPRCLISQQGKPLKTTLVPLNVAPNIPKRTTRKSCGSTQQRRKKVQSVNPFSSMLYLGATKSKLMLLTMAMWLTSGAPALKGSEYMMKLTSEVKSSVQTNKLSTSGVNYIEIASRQVGTIKLKAWTSKEYETKNAIYSCPDPQKKPALAYRQWQSLKRA